MYNLLEKCELCGRTAEEETKSDHLRIINIINNYKLCYGYFQPYSISIDEKYSLGKGEHTICSNRRACNKRQRKNKKVNLL